jgi:uncharacterized protein YceK
VFVGEYKTPEEVAKVIAIRPSWSRSRTSSVHSQVGGYRFGSGLRRSLRVPFVLLPLVLLAAVSGCGSVASGSTAEAAGGTVANPTGSIKGQTLTGLVDAYTGNWGGLNGTSSATTTQVGTAKAQWQHAVLLSDHTGACGREGSGGGYAGNEVGRPRHRGHRRDHHLHPDGCDLVRRVV